MTTSTTEPERNLKRYLYLCSEDSKYVPSKVKFGTCIVERIPSFFELVSGDKDEYILKLIDTVNKDPQCAKRESILFILAASIRHLKEKNKSAAYEKILTVCKTLDELLLFIKFAHSINKPCSNGLRRMLRQYYAKIDTPELSEQIIKSPSNYGWSHRDVFKLAHIKPKNLPQDVLMTYIIKNLEEAKKKVNAETTTPSIETMLDRFEKWDELKKCTDETKAVELLKTYKFAVKQIPSHLLKLQPVWDVLIPKLDIPSLLPEIPRLHRLGFLKLNSVTAQKVIDVLIDNKKCKMHPAQVFIYLKNYERGKPLDPKRKLYLESLEAKFAETNRAKQIETPATQPKNTAVIGAMFRLLHSSFRNLYATGRRVMITVDVREETMGRLCFENNAITCLEAASLIILSFVKAEKDVTVAVFNGCSISLLPVEKGLTYNQTLHKLKEKKGGSVILSSTFQWALENKKQFDVFINMFHGPDAIYQVMKNTRGPDSPITLLQKYRKTLRLPNTKLINVSLNSRKLEIADGSPHVLDVCGFDQYVPKVIEACCKGVLK